MDDDQLVEQFERGTLPIEQWHHRQHVKVAYLYLLRYPLDAALELMRDRIRAYNQSHNVPDSLTSGYHETITRGWLHLVEATLREFGPSDNADAFVDSQTQLLSKRALLFFYRRATIMSAEAKHQFVEPDLAPLPCSDKPIKRP